MTTKRIGTIKAPFTEAKIDWRHVWLANAAMSPCRTDDEPDKGKRPQLRAAKKKEQELDPPRGGRG
jgi:hypothetical protein